MKGLGQGQTAEDTRPGHELGPGAPRLGLFFCPL